MHKIYFINKLQRSRILPRRFYRLTSSLHAVRFETAKVGLRERSKRTYRPLGILALPIPQSSKPCLRIGKRRECGLTLIFLTHTTLVYNQAIIIAIRGWQLRELLSLEILSKELMNLCVFFLTRLGFLSRIGSYLQRE